MLTKLHTWLRPSLVALFYPSIPISIRWRLLVLQHISLLTYTITSLPYTFTRPFTEEYIPITPGRKLRILVFKSSSPNPTKTAPRPIHVDIHGGGFIGGLPEGNAPFDGRLATETGAVVISLTYRYAPENTFPLPLDDVDAAVRFIQQHAPSRWGADPALMTVGGFSAGGCLAMASTQQPNCHGDAPYAYKAVVTFCGVLDNRVNPGDKPRPEGMPKDGLGWMLNPLFDSYGEKARGEGHMDDARLNPILAKKETLPGRILLCCAGLDILLSEQTEFTKRVNEEEGGQTVDMFVEEKLFHGYHEVPDVIVGKEVKQRAFTKAIDFLKETYAMHGWEWGVGMSQGI